MSATAAVIVRILNREGSGYTDDPTDRGGATKYGITIPFLADLRGQPQTSADIAKLTEADARLLYLNWLQKTQLNEIEDVAVLDAVADYAVNSGLDAGVRALQKALGVTVDGALGPQTLAAIDHADLPTVARLVTADRLDRLARFIAAKPAQARFASGWMERIAGVLRG